MALLRSVSGSACLAVVALLAALVAAPVHAGDDKTASLNNLIVRYSNKPDPFHWFSFYTMPRTIEEAKKDYFAEAEPVSCSQPYSIWCRKKDYRVCVVFDKKGNVAGLQISLSVKDWEKSKVPKDLTTDPQWERKKVLKVEVWATTVFFVSQCVLHGGGRVLKKDTPTAQGIYIKLRGNKFLIGPYEEKLAPSYGFTKQGCIKAQGQHYFYNTTLQLACEDQRPFFLLYGPQTRKLHGVGMFQYGESSKDGILGRKWFEGLKPSDVKIHAPTGPKCFTEWDQKYSLWSLHIYFVEKPWTIRC